MLKPAHGLLLAGAALLTTGVIMVTSAGFTVERPVSLGDVLLGRAALLAALAAVMMAAGTAIPVERLQRVPPRLVAAAVAALLLLLLAVHLPVIGREVNGARRWINLGFVSFQPSEVVKWGLVFVLAWYGWRHADLMGRLRQGLLIPAAVIGLACALIATEDLGTAVLVGAVGGAMLLAAGTRLRHAALLIAPAAAGLAAALRAGPYRLDRLRAFVDPYQDPQGIGYHMIQSMVTVAGGGVAGRGLGNGVQKLGYLPEDTTDFVFAVICEELGLAGAVVVACLFGCLAWCGWLIVRRTSDPFARLLGLGIVLTIGLQALINMAVVTGLAPTKGIALPLVSAGGTGWVMTAFCIGVLAGLEREGTGAPRHEGTEGAPPIRRPDPVPVRD